MTTGILQTSILRFVTYAIIQKIFGIAFNILRPRQDGHHFPDDILKCIFLNENLYISIKISLKFARKGPINNIPALVQKMHCHRPGDKPLIIWTNDGLFTDTDMRHSASMF